MPSGLAPCGSIRPHAPAVLAASVLLLLLATSGDTRLVQLLGGEYPVVRSCNRKSLRKRKELLLCLHVVLKSKLECALTGNAR
jgi:hypothetical protein